MKDREIQEFLMGGSSDSEIESDVESFHTASELEELSEEDAAEFDSATPVGEVPTPLEGDILWFADPQASCDVVPFTASSGLKVRPLDYWRIDDLHNHPVFRSNMSRDRFFSILRAFHFVRNPREGEPTPSDPLYKIRPLLNLFRTNVVKIYASMNH
ncbi:hypothetical protein J437_LFUL001703 [Ladona fulva]|uniref:PiggyBac transposable element-derived protein domain-containing protein n=1 Tax=Ladona fulva TaxID=123851 RepID=A0A8K0K3Z6_LADFU|nr:hypothetical protein J437_LFUL001703 [Ladona fulva]